MIQQNPFSLYDFLGYFIPGALLIYLYMLMEFLSNLKTEFKFENFLNNNNDYQLDQLLIFIILSYSLGHLINFMSSISIEKFAIWRYGYPSKYLLKLNSENYWKDNTWQGYAWRIILPTMILPVALFDFILGKLFKFKDLYTRSLDDFLIDVVKEKGLVLFNMIHKNYEGKEGQIKLREYDFFRIFAHYVYENSKNHQSKLNNYVALYGFLRTMTLITTIAFWFSMFHIIFINNCHIKILSVIILGFTSYLFFMAFMKFYRRYTLEGLMLIAVDRNIE